MEREKILKKFGNENYTVNDNTYIMGIHYLLGKHIAERFRNFSKILECCTGAGFMLIPLSKYVKNITTIDVSPEHISQARINVIIANVKSNINFVLGDATDDKILDGIRDIDAALLDPDWSAIGKVKTDHTTKFSDMQPSADELFNKIIKKTPNITLRLPRELDLFELKKLPPHELEKIYLDGDFKFYSAYFGALSKKIGVTEFRAFSN